MSKAAMQQALEALEKLMRFESDSWELGSCRVASQAIKALREALAEQPAQQEPVAALWQHGETGRTRITMPDDITDCDARWFKAADLYTSPQPAQRKPLTDEEIDWMTRGNNYPGTVPGARRFARAIEAALGIKENT